MKYKEVLFGYPVIESEEINEFRMILGYWSYKYINRSRNGTLYNYFSVLELGDEGKGSDE